MSSTCDVNQSRLTHVVPLINKRKHRNNPSDASTKTHFQKAKCVSCDCTAVDARLMVACNFVGMQARAFTQKCSSHITQHRMIGLTRQANHRSVKDFP